ncbi:Nuclear export mediator factor Nemf [Galdieria sulphuraria]|nr:Nuclear export mediator factor Nemf [Galdieria sulphuraria]
MPRNRFSLLDLQAEVKYLRRRFIGARVVNIYDVTPTTYLLKISVPSRNQISVEETISVVEESSNSNWEKTFVLIESGIRIHETRFYRDKANIPSGFSVKLRKHIRSRKIQEIRTLGADRVVELVFSSRVFEGSTIERPCRLIVEFYSSGNIVLTDEEYTILSALRSYKGPFGVTKEPVHIFTRNKYPVHLLRSNISLSKNSVLALLKNGSQTDIVRNFLSTRLYCGPQVIEHALVASGFEPKTKIKELFLNAEDNEEGVSHKTLSFLQSLESFESSLCDNDSTCESLSLERGYLFYRKDAHTTDVSMSNSERLLYEDFSPFLLCHLSNTSHIEFPTFNEAVDIYFANLEKERAQIVASKQESVVSKKVDSLRKDLERRIDELERAKEENFKIAEAIELNADEVDKAIWVVRAMIANGVAWDELDKMLEEEKEKGNPVAETIHSLHLDRNEITLMLPIDPILEDEFVNENFQYQSEDITYYDDTDETEEHFQTERMVAELNASKPVVLADVDLSLSAFANAARYFESRKRAQEKKEKTMEATKRALNVAEKKASKQMERSQQRSLKPAVAIREIRKPAWFEKFDWFISSENFLVIAGKDAQQNEQVVKRYMKTFDVYVHADIHGASSVVVKNRFRDKPVPLQTLIEAGAFAMCHSSAWSSKIVSSAWWVHASQVSKTAPSGEYLTTGSFMIRGKKNYLPPSQLVMGYGILFKMDPSCTRDHENERQRRPLNEAVEGHLKTNEDCAENEPDFDNLETFPTSATGNADQFYHENNLQEADVAHLFDKYHESLPDNLKTLQLDSTGMLATKEDELDQFRSEENLELIKYSRTKKARDHSTQVGHTKQAQPETFKEKKTSPVDLIENVDKKYAEQTLEERNLAMALLGSSKSEQVTSSTNEEHGREEISVDINKGLKGKGNHMEEVSNYTEDSKNADEEENNSTENFTDETSVVNLFTGQPLESDIIEFALPVCAPFLAVSRYKYRVKLIPGSMKKGKAAKVANSLMLKMAENNGNFRDRDLIRAIPDQDSIQTMLSNVRILSPGLQEVISKKKGK